MVDSDSTEKLLFCEASQVLTHNKLVRSARSNASRGMAADGPLASASAAAKFLFSPLATRVLQPAVSPRLTTRASGRAAGAVTCAPQPPGRGTRLNFFRYGWRGDVQSDQSSRQADR